jgi:hypothetical protein
VRRRTLCDTRDIAFVNRPKDFRSFLCAAKFRSGSARDDLAGDLLDDVIASKYVDVTPPDLDGLIAYCELIDSGDESRALALEWQRLRRAGS